MKLYEINTNCVINTNLYEGLICSYPPEKTINIITKKFKDIKYGIDKPFKKFWLEWSNYTKPDVQSFLHLINMCGWFISEMWVDYNDGSTSDARYTNAKFLKFINDENMIKFRVSCEPKYDIEIPITSNMIGQYLYHITDHKYTNNIETYGLQPRSGNKQTSHPERIYLALNYSSVKNIEHQMVINKQIKTPIIYQIDVSKLTNNIKLFVDPNAPHAVYTLNNISPKAIIQKIS